MILNLTEHVSTKGQREAGVVDLPADYRYKLVKAITFDALPTVEEVEDRAREVYNIVCRHINKYRIDATPDGTPVYDERKIKDLGIEFMIGGAPFLMKSLHNRLRNIGDVVYAFSNRDSKETVQYDGIVQYDVTVQDDKCIQACRDYKKIHKKIIKLNKLMKKFEKCCLKINKGDR